MMENIENVNAEDIAKINKLLSGVSAFIKEISQIPGVEVSLEYKAGNAVIDIREEEQE